MSWPSIMLSALIMAAPADATSPQTDPTASVRQDDGQAGDPGHGGGYCGRRLGAWFYCQTPQTPPPAPPAGSPDSPSEDDADIAAAENFKAEMERARLIAVWNPTEANIRRYYGFQQATMDKSGLFADTIRRLIWSDPSLDYTLRRPISAAAKTAWEDGRASDRDLFFRGVFDQIGLFYVYRGRCAPCRVASPVVRAFGQRYGIVIKPISTDGSPNPEFAEVAADRGQLKAWGITDPVTPAYLIFQKPSLDARGQVNGLSIPVSDGRKIALRPCANPRGCLTYLGAGVLSVDELAERLFVILGTSPGKDF